MWRTSWRRCRCKGCIMLRAIMLLLGAMTVSTTVPSEQVQPTPIHAVEDDSISRPSSQSSIESLHDIEPELEEYLNEVRAELREGLMETERRLAEAQRELRWRESNPKYHLWHPTLPPQRRGGLSAFTSGHQHPLPSFPPQIVGSQADRPIASEYELWLPTYPPKRAK